MAWRQTNCGLEISATAEQTYPGTQLLSLIVS